MSGDKRTLADVSLSPEDYNQEAKKQFLSEQNTIDEINETTKLAVTSALSDKNVINNIAEEITNKVKEGDVTGESPNDLTEPVKTAISKAFSDENLIKTIARSIANVIVDKINSLLTEFEDRIRLLEENSKKQELALKERNTEIKKLEKHCENQEQYSRRNSLRIYNQRWEEEDGEDTDRLVLHFIRTDLQIPIHQSDLDRSHRVGRPSTDNPRPILVKFVAHNMKNTVYRARRAVLKKSIYINEDLTKTRYQLLREALKLKKDKHVKDVWTNDGAIFVKTHEEDTHRVLNYDELCDVLDSELEMDNTVIEMSDRTRAPPALSFMGQGQQQYQRGPTGRPSRRGRGDGRGGGRSGGRRHRGHARAAPTYQPPTPAPWYTSTPARIGSTQMPNINLGPDVSRVGLPTDESLDNIDDADH